MPSVITTTKKIANKHCLATDIATIFCSLIVVFDLLNTMIGMPYVSR